jgi:chromosome segregation ATPase
MDLQLEEVDTLSGLEERVLRAVQLVGKLKEENAELRKRLTAAEEDARRAHAGRQEAEGALAELRGSFGKAEKELDTLLAERKQVRTRIEKLLGQIDVLSAG